MKPVFVIGHRNPDTDSICSAIGYANLKHILTGNEYIACRAGDVGAETEYVLKAFGVEPPRCLDSLHPRLSDVQFRDVAGISARISLRRAWKYMSEKGIQTIPVVDADNNLKGILKFSDIGRAYQLPQSGRRAERRTRGRQPGGSFYAGQSRRCGRKPGRDGGLYPRTRHGDPRQPV